MLGLKGLARSASKKNNNKNINIKEITDYYLKDSVSRNTAGTRQTKTLKKRKEQIRYLNDTLFNLHKKYRLEGGRYGFSTFYKYKPFYVLAPRLNSRDTCLCIKHENTKLQNMALKKVGALKTGVKDGLAEIVCDIKSYTCMYSECEDCRLKKPQFHADSEEVKNTLVSWSQWERQDHMYIKKELKEVIKTKKTAKIRKTDTLNNLQELYANSLQQFKTHNFNMEHQQEQYQKAVNELKEHEVLIVCDFSQNYEAKLANEIQSMHFGASKNQITLHTGMIYFHNFCQSFCTLSEYNDHKPAAIWAHLTPILNLIKEITPEITVIHFNSDGPSSQYRQKNNFYLLAHFTKKYHFSYCTWSFFESSHGKSVADGIGGCIKRSLNKKVSQGIDVADAKDAYDALTLCIKRIKFFLVSESDVELINRILPNNVQALKGTLKVHQIITDTDKFKVHYRNASCFCGSTRGKCDCFSLKTHFVVSGKVRQSQTDTSSTFHGDFVIPVYKTTSTTEENSFIPVISINGDSANEDSKFFENPIITAENSMLIHEEPTFLHKKQYFALPNLDVSASCKSENKSLDVLNLESESFSASDLESLKNIECIAFNVEQPSIDDLMHIDVMPIIIVPDNPKKCVNVENSSKHTRKPFTDRINTIQNKKPKSLNVLECQKCECSILGPKCKCIACKKWYCDECAAGAMPIDFICDTCLEG